MNNMLLKEQGDISLQRGMPVEIVADSQTVKTITEASVQLYYYNAGVLTADAGQAAGTVVVAKLQNGGILNALGECIGSNLDKSLAFTSTAFTSEVKVDFTTVESNDLASSLTKATNITSGFANGQYFIDYRYGTIYGKKATTQTALTAVSYKIAQQASSTMIIDNSGAQITSFGSPTTQADWKSPADFTATYTTSSTITLTGVPFTITSGAQIVYLRVRNTSTNITTVYVAGASGYAFGYAAGVITIYKDGSASTVLTANDMYELGVNAQVKTYDQNLDSEKSIEQAPLNQQYVEESLIDTTNIGPATGYYPASTGMSFGPFSGLSFTGKLIDADNTTTLTWEATNDEDTTNADWVDITKSFNDDNAGIATSIGASVTVTNATKTFAISKQALNYRNFRIKLVTGDSTNTVIVKMRRFY